MVVCRFLGVEFRGFKRYGEKFIVWELNFKKVYVFKDLIWIREVIFICLEVGLVFSTFRLV